MDDTDVTFDLIDTLAELRDAHGVNASYNQLYKACLDGTIPATRVRGRWRLRRADFSRIAAAFRGRGAPSRATRAREPDAAAA